MSNLLDKASILLTPTAYNDGSMLSVKPENGDGDFTFSRSSAATRVNAQGLVENVQIISPELVSNGNFSQIGTEEVSNGNFSQEGSELVTNGDFATDSNWTISGSSISISGGKLNFVNATSNSEFAQQSIVAPIGKTYKITLDVSNLGSGESIKIRYPFQDFTINTNGTHILYGVGNTANVFRLTPNSSTASFSIDNVSVKEVISATNTPRIDYSTGAEAFLLEPQSTNLITYSEDFSNAYWIKQPGVVATYNTTETLSPDGTYNATKFIGNGSTGVYKASIGVSGVVSRSVYLKSVSGTTTAVFKEPNTNLPTPITLTITNEWQRFEFIGDNGSALQGLWIDDITSDGLYMWGAQVEALPYATSYIPTSGAIATRNQEVCVDATPVINSEEGTLYLDASALTNGGVDRNISLNDNTSSNHVQLILHATDNRIVFRVNSGGVAQANISDYTFEQTDNLKIACVYKQNNFSLWINGIERATDFSGNIPIGLSKLDFSLFNGTQPFFGNIKGLKYYPKALADVQLEDLTTI